MDWLRALGLGCCLAAACAERSPPGAEAGPQTPASASAPVPTAAPPEPTGGSLPDAAPRALTGLEPLVEAYGALGLERQWHLNEVLPLGAGVSVDLEAGLLTLGDAAPVAVQVLGAKSDEQGTWTWAWADESPPLPAARLTLATRLRTLGQERGLAPLTTPRTDLTENLTFAIGAVAAGLGDADGWYFARQGDVAWLLVVDDPNVPALGPPTLNGLSALFMEFIDRFNVDHRRALEGYLRARGFAVESPQHDREPGQPDEQPAPPLRARHPSGLEVVAPFDAIGGYRGLRRAPAPEAAAP